MLATMIQREKIQELLSLPVDERRRVLHLLQESLENNEGECLAQDDSHPSPAAQWLLSMAGRYSGGPGNTAARADEILRVEIDKQRGLTTK